MKLLLDENLSFKLCERLSDFFRDATHVRLLHMERAEDRELWHYAATNGYTLITLDADFAELGTLFGPPPKIIWMRCGNQPTSQIEAILRAHIEAIFAFETSDAACLEIY